VKNKLVALAFLGLALTILGTIRINSRNQEQQLAELQSAPDRGTIAWRVRLAKAKGEREVVLDPPTVLYAASGSNLDEVLSNYTAVIAEPVAQRSYVSDDRQEVVTWYKFRIVENLSGRNFASCPTCSSSIKPSEEMLPLDADQFLMAKYGGVVVIDGIKVTTRQLGFPQFSMSTKYLLFVSLDSSGVAGMAVGPEGIFSVSDEGLLQPINDTPHTIKRELATRFDSSVYQLKHELKNRFAGAVDPTGLRIFT